MSFKLHLRMNGDFSYPTSKCDVFKAVQILNQVLCRMLCATCTSNLHNSCQTKWCCIVDQLIPHKVCDLGTPSELTSNAVFLFGCWYRVWQQNTLCCQVSWMSLCLTGFMWRLFERNAWSISQLLFTPKTWNWGLLLVLMMACKRCKVWF